MDTVAQIFQRPVERPVGKSFMVRDAIDGSVELREVSFSHAGNPMPALSNVSLSIQAGERVAIIGRSGSGKSTLAKLVAGLFEPASGAVLVGGADTRQLDPQQLRRAIGCVPQDPFLFNGTLRENIAYGCAVPDDAALLTAAQQAGVDEFAKVHPQGYDMPVGERGSRLSGGQRQAVVLARALVNPPLIPRTLIGHLKADDGDEAGIGRGAPVAHDHARRNYRDCCVFLEVGGGVVKPGRAAVEIDGHDCILWCFEWTNRCRRVVPTKEIGRCGLGDWTGIWTLSRYCPRSS